jgi:8-oxo-dGTP diphosphatase
MPGWTLLAADRPIVGALRLPAQLAFSPPALPLPPLAVEGPHLLRLRLPGATDAAYHRQARALDPRNLLLDRDPQRVAELGAAGFHATAERLRALRGRPVPADRWFGASCHDAADLARAAALGADYAVLGPVRPTPTHPGAAPLGWEGFARLAVGAGLPVYAIGGLGPRDLGMAWRHGGQGVAAISAYWRAGGSPGGGVAGSSSAGIA